MAGSKLTKKQIAFLAGAAQAGLYVPPEQWGAATVPPLVRLGLVTWNRGAVWITDAGRAALAAQQKEKDRG